MNLLDAVVVCRPAYRINEDAKETWLYRPGRGESLRCSTTAALIWRLCMPWKPVAECVDILVETYPEQAEVVRADVLNTLERFAAFGAVEFVSLKEFRTHSLEEPVVMQMKWIGRFGNRMFTYAFGCHYARTFSLTYLMPSQWEGTTLFRTPDDIDVGVIPDPQLRIELTRSVPSMDSLEYRTQCVESYNRRAGNTIQYVNVREETNYGRRNICFEEACMYSGWLLAKYTMRELRQSFEFSDEVKASELYKQAAARKGTYVAAHLRRGDICDADFKGANSVVSLASYYRAFEKYGIEKSHVEWVTDDLSDKLVPGSGDKIGKDWVYPEGQQSIADTFFEFFPDFLKLYFAGVIFRANSAFSWWAAALSTARVYSPVLTSRKHYHTQGDIECEFVEGNHPHFMGNSSEGPFFEDIVIPQ